MDNVIRCAEELNIYAQDLFILNETLSCAYRCIKREKTRKHRLDLEKKWSREIQYLIQRRARSALHLNRHTRASFKRCDALLQEVVDLEVENEALTELYSELFGPRSVMTILI